MSSWSVPGAVETGPPWKNLLQRMSARAGLTFTFAVQLIPQLHAVTELAAFLSVHLLEEVTFHTVTKLAVKIALKLVPSQGGFYDPAHAAALLAVILSVESAFGSGRAFPQFLHLCPTRLSTAFLELPTVSHCKFSSLPLFLKGLAEGIRNFKTVRRIGRHRSGNAITTQIHTQVTLVQSDIP